MSLIFTRRVPQIPVSGSVPPAVTGFRISKQGDSTNGNQSATNNVITSVWNASAGATSYVVRRGSDGGAKSDYATLGNVLTYTDNAATNAYSAQNIGEQSGGNNGGDGPTTVYDYDIIPVNAAGRGAASADCQMWCYVDGTQYCMFSGSDLSFGMSSVDFADTTLSPPTGSADIKCTITGVGAGFQPPTFSPGTWTYGAEVGAFNYLNVTCKPINSSQAWNIACLSRGPPGDVFPHILLNLLNYGPAPQAGVWATYKIPLADFGFGVCNFTGSISGGVLAVSSPSGSPMDCVGWISGANIATPTWISATPGQSGAGNYTVTGQSSAASSAMVYHRSNFYKFQIVTQSGVNGDAFGVANIYFSRV